MLLCATYVSWGAQYCCDFKNLIYFTGSGKQWPKGVHLSHYTTNCPQVYRTTVVSGTQQYFRSSIPKWRYVVARSV